MTISILTNAENNEQEIDAKNLLSAAEKRFYNSLCTLILFKHTDIGPAPIMGECRIPFRETDTLTDLLKLGSIYYTVVGQGSCYSMGLYGPLPVLNSDFRCLLFASSVKDPDQKDSRMEGRNYIVSCFFYHSALKDMVVEKWNWIEEIFTEFFENHKHIFDVVRDLNMLRRSLDCYILPK